MVILGLRTGTFLAKNGASITGLPLATSFRLLPKAWKLGCCARRAIETVMNYCERAATTRVAKYQALGKVGIDYAKRSPLGHYSRERECQIPSLLL